MSHESREDLLRTSINALRSAAPSPEIVSPPGVGDDLFTATFAPVVAAWVEREAADKAAVREAELAVADTLDEMLKAAQE